MNNKIDGWINLDKPLGMTSNQALSALKKILKVKKIGHIGTLDPGAEGVLPVAIGEATKSIAFINNEIKAYEFKVRFGISTDTLDMEGQVNNISEVMPYYNEIISILPCFIGKIKQVPPIYSAIKIDGQRAYDIARKGLSFEIPAREVVIHELKIIDYNIKNKEASFYVLCSKGTYVRSLAVDIAKKVNAIATVFHIKRVRSGVFFIKDVITIAQLEKLVHNDQLDYCIKTVEFVLDDILVVDLSTLQIVHNIKNGQSVKLNEDNHSIMLCLAKYKDKLVAIGDLENGFFKPLRIFNL